MEEVKTLTFDISVSSMEYVADGEILVITYGKTIAFYNALRYPALSSHTLETNVQCLPHSVTHADPPPGPKVCVGWTVTQTGFFPLWKEKS